MKKGFTLVELSIVLVIIGLLIGGILIGQTLIDSARISNFIKYAGQLDIAVAQFENKFRCMPGDCSALGGTGNDSGYVGMKCSGIGVTPTDCSVGATHASMHPEAIYFWQHLAISGFKPDGVTYDINYTGFNDGTLGVNFPKVDSFTNQGTIKINNLLDDRAIITSGTWARATRHHFSYGTLDSRQSNATSNIVHGGFVNPVTMMAIDQKIDDGDPILGHTIINPTDSLEFGSCDTPSSSPVTYNLDNTERACSVTIGFGFTTERFDLYNDTWKGYYGY